MPFNAIRVNKIFGNHSEFTIPKLTVSAFIQASEAGVRGSQPFTHLTELNFPLYQLNQSISVFRVCWVVFFIFIEILIKHSIKANSWNPDQLQCSAVSELEVHCLPMSH